MTIHPRLKYILVCLLCTFIFIVSFNNYRSIILFVDSVRGKLLAIRDDCAPKEYSTTGQEKLLIQNYSLIYKKAPAPYLHCGNILLYKVTNAISIRQLARRVLPYTSYLRTRRLAADLKKINAITGDSLAPGTVIAVPGSLPSHVPDYRDYSSKTVVYTNGLYYSGYSMGNGKILNNLEKLKLNKINTIVFDAKDITGIVNYDSDLKTVNKYRLDKHRSIDNISHFIRILHTNRFYTIARIAVFRDHLLIKKAPHLAIQSRKNGTIWNRGSKELWCDPTNKAVQDYNIGLAEELAQHGVDEIQFDYIRFPTVGDLSDARYAYDFDTLSKEQSIALFLKRAQKKLVTYHTRLSIDIFGVVAWGKQVDINKTGQRIELLAQYCDVISPMLYPSHFNDEFDGYAHPGDEPYYFIYTGNRKVAERARNRALVRPWLQAFSWRVSNYNKMYILKQIKASIDSGAHGYLFWNASNNYEEVLEAMQHVEKIN